MTSSWWQTAAVYHIYPLSFADSDGDGYGDLAGITGRLDHLAGAPGSLGVDAIWLSPIYRSPMVDFGYDVADHCDVDPRFGTLGDLDELVEQAHRRGLKVLLDFVPNHTSDQHRWFREARQSRTSKYRDFYLWADPGPDGGPPNNWLSAFPAVGGAWTLDPPTGQYYLHSYTRQQPDLNWRNPAVRAAMHEVLRFWLDRGVDGFRIDAPHRLAKDAALRDNPPEVAHLRLATQLDGSRHLNIDTADTHQFLREIRAVVDAYPDAVLVGEIGVHHPERRRAYYGSLRLDGTGDELQLIFDFVFWNCPWNAAAFRKAGDRLDRLADAAHWPTHALSNHDISRHATRFARSMDGAAEVEPRARVAAMMLLTLPGTVFLYYGEEIGMTDVPVSADRAADPDGRDPCRTPMQWNSGPAAGFSRGEPWLPVDPDGPTVAAQRNSPTSLLTLYRELLALRRSDARFTAGDYRSIDAAPDVYAFARSDHGSTVLVVLNFATAPVLLDLESALPATGPACVLADTIPGGTGRQVALTMLVLDANQGLVVDLGPTGDSGPTTAG